MTSLWFFCAVGSRTSIIPKGAIFFKTYRLRLFLNFQSSRGLSRYKNPLPFPARDFSLYRLYHNQYPSNKPLLLCIVHIRVLAVLLDQLLMCTALYDLTVLYV